MVTYVQKKIEDCDYSTTKYFELEIQHDDEKIGAVGLFISYDEDGKENSAYVKSIGIDEAHRNHGYGTEVLKSLAQEHGGIYICPDNADAERLYKRLGEELDYRHVPQELTAEIDEYGVMYYID